MKREDSQRLVSALTANFHPSQEVPNSTYYPSSPSQQDFQKIHLEYLAEKEARKREFQKRKREEFGASSSEEDDVGGSQSESDSQRRQSTVEEEMRFRESEKIRSGKTSEKKEEALQVYFSMKKIKEAWTLEGVTLNEQSITIGERSCLMKEIHKIKLMQGVAIADCHRIKISTLDQNELFLAANTRMFRGLPLNYYLFAFIIQQKLINMGRKLHACSAPSLPGIPETLTKNSYNFGKIYKKSQIFGKWEERLVVVNREGIFSYKKFNEKHSMYIAGNSVKEIWTRFEVQEGLLVVKILHSSSTKTEFGFPLTQLLDRRCWLFAFYLLAFPQ